MQVYLVGYRASGKTSFGKGLASRLGLRFSDMDDLLIEAVGKSIGEIFAEEGQEAFRGYESDLLARLLAEQCPGVYATGGGIVEKSSSRQLLAAASVPVIYLTAPVEVLQNRLRANLGDRPSLTGSSPIAEVSAMVERRDPWYRQVASAVVDGNRDVEKVYADLMAIVENFSKTD